MTKKPDQKAMLWRYVHQAVDTEEDKNALEEALQTEGPMRKELKEIQRTHSMLKNLMPLVGQSDDQVIDTVVQAWDHEQAANTLDDCTKPTPKLKGNRLIRFPVKLGMALAASICVFIGIQAILWTPIRWRVQYGDLEYRGEVPIVPVYSRQEMKSYSRILMSSVEDAYESKLGLSKKPEKSPLKRRWNMSLFFQELPGGWLSVTASLHEESSRGVDSWKELFESKASITERLPEFANQIALDLVDHTSNQ